MLNAIAKLDPGTRSRLWLMYHVIFVLLLVHAALVYLAPGYFQNPVDNVRALIAADPFGAPTTRVVERQGRKWLSGGPHKNDDFDVTTFRLKPDQLHYGLGREVFPALIEPEFVSATEADAWLHPNHRVLAVKVGQDVRVYPIDLLIQHEVVNDMVGGIPIFAAYCILADLGAVYDRRLDGHTLTFALSGYTYTDPKVWEGRDAFVLWDRETESLWWPPIGKAVSGPLVDRPLTLLDNQYWSQSSWGQVRSLSGDVRVLKPDQDFERPVDWPRLTTLPPQDGTEPEPAIAPRWGQNASW
ncbi:MAG: hypothetical protein Kow00105_05500 [Phycisphaeraceae bacterium]